jgi:hypothetical protein
MRQRTETSVVPGAKAGMWMTWTQALEAVSQKKSCAFPPKKKLNYLFYFIFTKQSLSVTITGYTLPRKAFCFYNYM